MSKFLRNNLNQKCPVGCVNKNCAYIVSDWAGDSHLTHFLTSKMMSFWYIVKFLYTLFEVPYLTEIYKQWLNNDITWLFIDLLLFRPCDASFPAMFLACAHLSSALTSSNYPTMIHCLLLSSILYPIWFPHSRWFSPLSIPSQQSPDILAYFHYFDDCRHPATVLWC